MKKGIVFYSNYSQSKNRKECFDRYYQGSANCSIKEPNNRFYTPISINRYICLCEYARNQIFSLTFSWMCARYLVLHIILLLYLLIQNSRETINGKEMFQSVPFIYIDQQSLQFQCEFDQLRNYSEDKIKFMTKFEVNETRCDSEKNKIMLVKQPIYSSEDIITFLLIFKWYPNCIKSPKQMRKGSFATEKQISNKFKYQKPKIDHQQLLNAAFLISEKIYIEEKFIDQFINILSEKNDIERQQLNCITVILNDSCNNKNFISTGITSSHADTKYHFYQYQNHSNYNSNYMSYSDYMEKQMTSPKGDHLKNINLTKRSSSKMMQKSPKMSNKMEVTPRMSARNTVYNNPLSERKKLCNFNIGKVKKYFSVVQYIISESQVGVELIMYHLCDNKNAINLGFRVETIEQLFAQWSKYSTYTNLYNLNKQKILNNILNQSLYNYKLMISMELEELSITNLETIYFVIKQFNDKIINQFLESTKQYINSPNYSEYIAKLQSELSTLQTELINNYALSKYQYGFRVIKNLEKKKSKKNQYQNYTIMKIIGRQEINNLEIGYRMYKQLIQSKLTQSFKELLINRNEFKYKFNVYYTGNNDEDLLNHIENRIQICQEKRKMFENAIQLSIKQGQSLQLLIKNYETQTQIHSIISERIIEE